MIEIKITFIESLCIFLPSKKIQKILIKIETLRAYPKSILSLERIMARIFRG